MKNTKKIEKELIFDIVLFCVGISSISLFYTNNILLVLLLFFVLLIGIKFWYKSKDIYFLIFGAIVGPAGEIACVYFGVWKYVNPSFLGIPVWLPLAWGLATILIKRFAGIFVKIERK